jgi:prefoldin subunit 5
MAKEAKVISTPQSSCPLNDYMDEDTIIAILYKTICSLRGDAHAHFEYLMDTIAQCNESLNEARSHVEDGKQRFNLLAQELNEEKNTSFLLSQQIVTYQLDKTKDMDTLDKTLLMSQELDASKKELEVAHASLTKDLEHLERANKLVKDEINRLSKKYEELQAIHKEVLGSSSVPIIVENIACATNSSLDKAIIIEENAKLKAQLEKERLTLLNLGNLPMSFLLNKR